MQVRPDPTADYAYVTLPTGEQTEIRKMKEILHCVYAWPRYHGYMWTGALLCGCGYTYN